MLTYIRTIAMPGRPVLRQSLELPVPLIRITTCCGVPSATTLNRFATAFHATAAAILIGGVVAISITAHSDLSAGVKAGACMGTGLIMLGSCYCCKLSSTYAEVGTMLHDFLHRNAFDAMDMSDELEEMRAIAGMKRSNAYMV